MPKKIKKDIIPEKRLLMWKVLDLIVPFIPIIILGIIQWDVYFGIKSKNAFDNIVVCRNNHYFYIYYFAP